MRINQFVAQANGMSRRAADEAIIAGRVKINARPAALGQKVTSDDHVTLDDAPLQLTETYTYLMLNKPVGYVSSRTRQGNDPTLYELIPARFQNVRIAGRLDRDSSGLILLSDDGDFVQDQSHPSRGKTKQYDLVLSSPLTASDRARLQAGIRLSDGPSQVSIIKASGKSVTVTLAEGRNRQLRRTFGALGYGVERLHRTRIGMFELSNLAPGDWREISLSGDPA